MPIIVSQPRGVVQEERAFRTIAEIRVWVPTSDVVLPNVFAVSHSIFGAFRPCNLVVASASFTFALLHVPLLEAAQGDVLPKQHVESCIYVFDHVVANENDGIETFQDHAYLGSRVPAVMAACWMEGCIEPVTTTTAHGLEKGCSVVAIVGMLINLANGWWDVKVCR